MRIILAIAALGTVVSLPLPQTDTPADPGAAGTAAATIPELVAEVDRRNLLAAVAALEGFGTRYASTSAGEASATEIGEWFTTFGLPTEFEYFQFGTAPPVNTSNVIATLPGTVDPSRIVIVSAHYDSRSDQPQTFAPGADDNASGVALVVELARIMANHRFDFTVKFIAWGAEERGLVGSRHHAQRARQRGDPILACVVADMVGYADVAPEDLDVVSDDRSQWLAQRYAAAAASSGGLAAFNRVRTQFGSDCMAFWEQGYASACAIEDDPPTNPHYHKATDTHATVNLDFLTATTRGTLALIAQLAQPISTPAPPTRLQVVSQTSTSLFRRARSVLLTWEASEDAVVGYHVYRAATSHGAYRRLTTSPLNETFHIDQLIDEHATFHYAVTAVDRSGRESNYSAEVSDESRP